MSYYIAIIGLLLGSFINVVIYRIPNQQSVAWPPSHCPHCNQKLVWWQLIPVISWLLLKGKCSNCKASIAVTYPLTELAFGVVYVLLYDKFGLTIDLLSSAFLFSLLYPIAAIDIQHGVIPDQLNVTCLIFGFILAILGQPGLSSAMFGFVVGGGVMLMLAMVSKGGMGGGDIKLTAILGLFLGWKGVLIAIFLGAVIGAVIGVSLQLLRGKSLKKATIPFGPFLAIGAMTTYLYGGSLVYWYSNNFLR